MGGDSNGAMPSFGGSTSTTGSNSSASAGSNAKGNAQEGPKAGKGSTSTMANLAQGAMDVAKAKIKERIGETTGGKIAASIRASGQGAEISSATFNDDSLSAGISESVDPEAEVAAFRDRTSQTS
jgi:type IV secretion system protein TrbL